jgi:DNA primase
VSGLVPQHLLDQIRSANDIVDVVGAVVPLRRAGVNFVGLCPFHREKTPSFNVSPGRQIFHCFGCQKGGDVFTFVREYESLGFMEAVKRLADRAGIVLELDQSPGQTEARHLKESLFQIHEQIAQRWQSALANEPGGQIARDYLNQRGVSAEAIRAFRLGYAPEAWDDTVNWAKHKGFDLALVEQGGLIVRKEGTDRRYDRFRGRLMFPICDEQSRVIAFSGRVLAGDEKTAKYVNSPETPIFRKGRVFYGLDKAKRAILDAGFAIICEGQLDLIACHSAGVTNVVAPQGTAFTPEHARLLKRYVNEVVLCFDSDAAGQKAAVRVFDSLLAAGVAVRVATVPAPHDPDSFIKEFGGDAFQDLIKKAEGFFDFYLGLLCRTNEVGQDKGRMTVVREMAEALQKTRSPVLVDTYAQKVAFRLAVNPDAVRAEFQRTLRSGPSAPDSWADDESEFEGANPATAGAAPVPPPSEREFWLLRLILSEDDQMEWVNQHLDPAWIQHPVLRQIVAERLALFRSQEWRGLGAFIEQLQDAAASSLLTQAATDAQAKGDRVRNLAETIRMLRNDAFDRELEQLKLRLGQPGLLEDAAIAILRRQTELRSAKSQPLTPLPRPEGE